MPTITQPENRAGKIAISWAPTGIGTVTLDGEHWASVEWSEKRQRWCVEDIEGRCLTHTASIHGMAPAKAEAIALAEAMIRDGRMPAPDEARAQAKERRRIAAEKRASQPAQIKRREEREEAEVRRREAWSDEWEAEAAEKAERPLYEVLAATFDFADPELWKSNSFAALRSRLVIHVNAAIAKLNSKIAYEARRATAQPFGTSGKAAREARRQDCEREIADLQPKLDRAKAILTLLTEPPSRRARQ